MSWEKRCANWVINEVLPRKRRAKLDWEHWERRISRLALARLIALVAEGKMTNGMARRALDAMVNGG